LAIASFERDDGDGEGIKDRKVKGKEGRGEIRGR
jgi:hypothetical protein